MLRDEGTDKFSFNKAWYLYRERRIVMVKRNIVLGNVANVQEFNRICGHMDFDVDLAQGKYLVDAKSIMGIFSLDINERKSWSVLYHLSNIRGSKLLSSNCRC